jgi:DNA-binding NarL/FixJ family response regulator
MNVVLAAHSRELKTALYLAINATPDVTIVATAASTAELVSYCHAFQPEVAIVETGLPGRPLPNVLGDLQQSKTPRRILVIGEDDAMSLAREIAKAELLQDTTDLATILADLELESGSR